MTEGRASDPEERCLAGRQCRAERVRHAHRLLHDDLRCSSSCCSDGRTMVENLVQADAGGAGAPRPAAEVPGRRHPCRGVRLHRDRDRAGLFVGIGFAIAKPALAGCVRRHRHRCRLPARWGRHRLDPGGAVPAPFTGRWGAATFPRHLDRRACGCSRTSCDRCSPRVTRRSRRSRSSSARSAASPAFGILGLDHRAGAAELCRSPCCASPGSNLPRGRLKRAAVSRRMRGPHGPIPILSPLNDAQRAAVTAPLASTAGADGRRQRQDARPDSPDRVADTDRGRLAARNSGGHLHQQGRRRNARPRRALLGHPRWRAVARHLSRTRTPVAAPAWREAGLPQSFQILDPTTSCASSRSS